MNLSFVIPFYRRADLFRLMLPINAAFQTPGVEVVCVLDDPQDEPEILDIVKTFRNIKFRVLVNDSPHDWRLPCIALNVGIRNAVAPVVAIMSPETGLVLPYPDYLDSLSADSFYSGLLWSLHEHSDNAFGLRRIITKAQALRAPNVWGFGFLMAPKDAIASIRGYDESAIEYGSDDAGMRFRLNRLGLSGVVDGHIKLFHLGHDNQRRIGTMRPQPYITPHICLDQPNWGKAFSRVAWDWIRS